MSSGRLERALFDRLVEDPDRDGGLDETARAAEPANFLRHGGSLASTKLADGLLDPKLVLSWLVTNLGASGVLVGLLVPIREAGALLPQLVTAPRIHAMARRKWAWAGGSFVQGLAAVGIAVAALTLEGDAAGVAICVLLGVLAIARSVCSVSHKDVLGKTVGSSRRGSVTGFASSVASAGVVVFAIVLLVGTLDRFAVVVVALVLAAAGWLFAAAFFATITEEPTPREHGGTPWGQLRLLRQDPQLVRMIVVRGLLTATALAPPYLVLLGSSDAEDLANLGGLVLASAAASLLSSYVWGRLSDHSSRAVLERSGLAAAVALVAALALQAAGLATTVWAMPVALFGLMISYHGVRVGRSTYLVDMAPEDQRPAYTAVANTVIGVILLVVGALGAAFAAIGAAATIGIFAGMCVLAAVLSRGLDEVEVLAPEARSA
ncbi:hypothetical protein KLP28_05375 [Nocardioidaceae bacterium]|nr:hypothetical protein KLP28_05375 [Nocardioidaceae bacterium]